MSRLPVLRIATRSFSAQAQPARSNAPKAGITTTVLPNKTFVAALDNGSPIARITVAYKAGSRYEPKDEAGLVHHLRVVTGITTSRTSAFAITRNVQQYGANIITTTDRETFCYTLEAGKNQLERVQEFLSDVASKQEFWPWEVEEVLPRIKYEIAGLPPQVRTFDLLHKVCFRRGLGNSLFSSPRQVGKISPESYQHYIKNNFTADRCSVASVGLSLESTVAFAQSLNIAQSGSKQDTACSYKDGEIRKEIGGDVAHVALALEGTSLGNTKEALALAVLSRALANGPQVKWGCDNSPLSKAIAKELSSAPFVANGFNVSYTDTGVFGVFVTASKDQAGKAVQVAGKVLKSGLSSIGADALKRGRKQLQLEILNANESFSALVDGMATQGLLTGAVPTPVEVAESITKITDSDISSVINKVSKSKLSMAAVGALSNVPYADEI